MIIIKILVECFLFSDDENGILVARWGKLWAAKLDILARFRQEAGIVSTVNKVQFYSLLSLLSNRPGMTGILLKGA